MKKATELFAISRRHGCRLLHLNRSSFAYRPRGKPDERALTIRIRDIAAVRVRYGYRRITALLQHEGWQVGDRRVYNIYKAEGLVLRSKKGKKRAAVPRLPLAIAEAPSQRWSMDFVTDKLANGKRFRVLTVIDHFDRSCPVLFADHSIGAHKVVEALESTIFTGKSLPQAITINNGPEFAGRVLDAWAYGQGIMLDFIRPGKPTENGYIESFNGKLRDELLNTSIFFNLAEAWSRIGGIEQYRHDYNTLRPHSSLDYQPPAQYVQRAGLKINPTQLQPQI